MHLQEATIVAVVLDQAALSPADAAHLAVCGECRARLAWWQVTGQDLNIARMSTPSDDALVRYQALFPLIERVSSGVWQKTVAWIATLAWDSRRQSAGAGIRTGGSTAYRLLYAAEPCEVELMIEPSGRMCVIEGEWVEREETNALDTVLVELVPMDAPTRRVVTVANEDGRFRLADVLPGVYRMTLMPGAGSQVTIEPLEIG